MAITYKSKKKEFIIISRKYFTNRFQGIVFAIDFDKPNGFLYKNIFLFEVKLLFFCFWLTLDWRYKDRYVKQHFNNTEIRKKLKKHLIHLHYESRSKWLNAYRKENFFYLRPNIWLNYWSYCFDYFIFDY